MRLMRESEGLEHRKDWLRNRGPEDLAPLWIEHLEPEEGLRELSNRSGALFRLQEAYFLLRCGRGGEARAVLEALEDLPRGLRRVFDDLWERVAEGGEETSAEGSSESSGIASRTLADLYLSQGDRDAAVAMYRELAQLHPDDGEIRSRLRALVGGGEPQGLAELATWLERVRRWRAVQGA